MSDLKTYDELTPEIKVIADAYGKAFPETFKEIQDGSINNSDFARHLFMWEAFKAGWKAREEQG